MKKLSNNQVIGQRGEWLVGDRALAMGFSFDVRDRLETGIDAFLELRDRQTGRMLANWIGVQVKTTEAGLYSHEDDRGFDFLLKPDDLEYWRSSNIPVIIVLVRLDRGDMYWKHVEEGQSNEPRRLRFDTAADRFDRDAADRIAALCVERDRLGSYVPPMRSGENVHLNMIQVLLPEEIFVGASLYSSGSEAARELAKFEGHAPFDWVVRSRRFISFRDPRGGPLGEIIDEGSVEVVETGAVGLTDDIDDEHAFIDLLARTLSVQLDDDLSYDRESRGLFFRAPAQNKGRKYRYRSLINETSAEVVSVWRDRNSNVGSVRHHAFIPRFQRLGDEWLLSVTPTFVFTRDGFRSHYNASALIAGKKKKEKNGAVRGQFVMWRHLLLKSGELVTGLLADQDTKRRPILRFEALDPIEMPLAVPEDAWRREDPNAEKMIDTEWLV
jgi:hypothetical protein